MTESADPQVTAAPVPRTAADDPPRRRRGRRPDAPATTAIAQEVRRRREMLHLTVRAAARRTGVSPSVISEIEMGRRVPSLATYAKLREGLGLDVPPTVLMAPRPGAGIADDHLTALAACVVSRHGGPLTDLAAALEVSVPDVREGVLRIAGRLAAVGFQVVDDSVEVRLAPTPAATAALDRLGTVDIFPELPSQHLEAICAIAHQGTATRSEIEHMLGGADCELLLRRFVERGLAEKVMRDQDAVGAPAVYRITAAAIAATGHASLESLQRFLANAVASQSGADTAEVDVLGRRVGGGRISATALPTPVPSPVQPAGGRFP